MKVTSNIIIILIITHWQGLSLSVNTFESTPPAVSGVLTACAGQRISLTCSHDNITSSSTHWIASLPLNCITHISHTAVAATPPCNPFIFQGIIRLVAGITLVNSTAVVTTTVNMTGTNIECRGGNVLNFFSVGNISLCVVGELYYILLCVIPSMTNIQN